MSRHRIVTNLLIMGSSQAITWVISASYLILLSRYLGPAHLGELMLAQVSAALLGLMIGLGMDTWITRTVAREPQRSSVVVSAALTVRGLLALLVPIMIAGYVHAAHLNAETREALYIYAVGTVFGLWGDVFLATFQGHEKMSLIAATNIAFNIVGLVLAVIVAAADGSVVAFALVSGVNYVSRLALCVFWTRHFTRFHWRLSWRVVREVLSGSLAFWATALFYSYYTYIDSIILAQLAGNQAVGFYSPATRLYQVAMFLPTIVMAVTLPAFSRLGLGPGHEFVKAGRKTLSLLMACGVPFAIGLIAFAGPIIRLMFGAAFEPVVPVMIILASCIPFTYINIVFYQLLVARDRQLQWTYVMAAGCLINPLVNWVTIPLAVTHWHNGAIGAALALLVTEALMVVYGVFVLRDVVLHPEVGWMLADTLMCGAAQAVILWVVGSQPLIQTTATEVLAGVVYLGLAMRLGVLPRQEVRLLWTTAVHRPRRLAA